MDDRKIYFNGFVLTMDPADTQATALATLGDRIIAVGTGEELLRLSDGYTETIDLEGRTVVPGFIETHCHMSWAAMNGEKADCSARTCPSIPDVIESVRARAVQTAADQWVWGFDFDDTAVAEKRHLTVRDLDAACPDLPVIIMHISAHLAYVNSRALAIAGIDRDTPQPPDGEIDKDAQGNPTGLFKEMAIKSIIKHVPPFGLEQMKSAFVREMACYNADGITSVHDAAIGHDGHGPRLIRAYRELARAGKFTVRVYMTIMAELFNAIEKLGFGTGSGDEMLRIGSVKYFQDGSIQGLTGALKDDYYNKSGWKGALIVPQATLDEQLAQTHRNGQQIAIHANGDAAIESVITALERAQDEFYRADSRHMIIHCQTASEDHIRRMKRLGAVPSYFVNHVYYWGDRHRKLFLGPQRAERISPLRSSLDQGLKFTLHSDNPVTAPSPLFSMYCAVNRITREGYLLGTDQRVSPLEALRAYTCDAAFCSFEEHLKGSIEPGKLADFVVLSDNPLTVAPERIKDIQVLRTVMGGKTVHRID